MRSMLESLMIAVIGMIVASFIAYNAGVKHERNANAATTLQLERIYKEAEKTLILKHTQDMIAETKRLNGINKGNADEYESKLTKVRALATDARRDADRLGGLRITAASCTGVGLKQGVADAQTTGTSTHNETSTGTIKLPDEVEDNLWRIVNDSDEIVEQARSCQNWIQANGFYGEPNLK